MCKMYKENDKIKVCVYSVRHNNIFNKWKATSFGHNGHNQANVSQKLKQAGTYSAKSPIYMGSYTSVLIFINSLKINNLKMCYL
jgi:hypothetical protein